MSSIENRQVRAFLRRLDRALRDLPSQERREIVEEIEAHILESLSRSGDGTETEVLRTLEEVGDPETIAADARARFGVRPARPGPKEILALVMLLVGGVLLPFIGWILGVVLLWASGVWNTREKLLGTFVVPFGLALPAYLLLFPSYVESCSETAAEGRLPFGQVNSAPCPLAGPPAWLATAGIVVLATASIVTVVYLAWRMSARDPWV